MASKDWMRSGSFAKKPASGWLHSDANLNSGQGVYYPALYIGSLPIDMSMQSLGFEDRTTVTREAITLTCEAANISQKRRRNVQGIVRQCISQEPTVKCVEVKFTIATSGISIIRNDNNDLLGNHIMPNISFATGGDGEESQFVGYVAKDSRNRRECHIFDCYGKAPDIIATVGQAFELRFKSFLAKGGGGGSSAPQPSRASAPQQALYDDAGGQGYNGSQALYDDIGDGGGGDSLYGGDANYGSTNPGGDGQIYGGDALYDEGAADPGIYGGDGHYGEGGMPQPGGGARYLDAAPMPDDQGWGGDDGAHLPMAPTGSDIPEYPLPEEPWFHGQITREEADALLQEEADFLVRESMDDPRQNILTVLQNGNAKHIQLVDPAGRVRTQDMMFNGVSHLINYHLVQRAPINFRTGQVKLDYPVENQGAGTQNYGGSVYGE